MKNWIYLFTASCLIFSSCTGTKKSEGPEKYQLHMHIDSLQQGTQYACTHFPKNIKRGLSLAFRCSFERFTSVSFGKGKGGYRCGYFQITADSLFYRINRNGEANDTAVYAAAHGLTISRHLGFSVADNDGNFTGTLKHSVFQPHPPTRTTASCSFPANRICSMSISLPRAGKCSIPYGCSETLISDSGKIA